MTVLYLKYRPQTLDDLIGQKSVKETLKAAADAGKLSHAYLFVGPRGTGKTSTARILAKMVNCEGKGIIPCNKCSTCLSITDGSNLDLIEIDAASNRGIDDIRALRETIKLSPSRAKKKVYIIDEVHMLTTEAFNALLKTLEEPPDHALFILATTESNKIPSTILSRVTRLDFKLASNLELIEALKRVAQGEKLNLEEEALSLLARKAEGSFRDGVKFLDQLSSTNKEIKLKDVEVLGIGNFEVAFEMLEKLAEKTSAKALLLVVKQIEKGVVVKDFILFLMDLLRSINFIKNDLGVQLVKEDVGSDKYQKLMELSNKFSIPDVVKSLDSLQNALEKLRIASIPSLPLELAVVEICQDQSSEKTPVDTSEVKSEVTIADTSDVRKEQELPGPRVVDTTIPQIQHPTSSGDLSKITDKWTFVLETIRQNNFSLEALLRSAKIADCSKGVVLIEVPYAFHQRILEQPKSRDLIEAVLSDVLAEPVKVSTVLGTHPKRIEDIANVEVAPEDEIISLASEIFNGKLVD